MPRRVGIVQSSYIPWKGYFDLVNSVDEFILYDDVQFTQRDWRSRNRIKTAHGSRWLTIPIKVAGRSREPIRAMQIADASWRRTHWASIARAYARAPHFEDYRDWLGGLYASATQSSLSAINHHFIQAICRLLGIRTRISWSMDYELASGPTERLVSLCRQLGATEYVSGPAAQAYIETDRFEQAGIALTYMDYTGYPEYPQLHGPFDHQVSIVDLILNTGLEARCFMKSFGGGAARE